MSEIECHHTSDIPHPNETGACEVCGELSKLFCQNCCQVYYCCREHQKSNWKQHKPKCFPVKSSNIHFYKELVATRKIKVNEVFLEESPFIIFPHSGNQSEVVCLECCSPITNADTIHLCSSCGWELCSENCQNGSMHRKNECEIFARHQIRPTCLNQNKILQCLAVGIVRTLLMTEKDPTKWHVITKTIADVDVQRERCNVLNDKTFLCKFIREECHLERFDQDTIDLIFAILSANSFDVSDYRPFLLSSEKKFRNATLIFPLAVQGGSNCVPNSRFIIDGRSTGNFKLVMVANVPVSKGESMSVTYENGLSATVIRRPLKERLFYRKCSCERCKDPTELGTHLASLKCKICSGGYCLPINSLDNDSCWECTSCHTTLKNREVLHIIDQISQMLQTAGDRVISEQVSVEQLIKCISKLKKEILHPNHFMVLNAEFDVCKRTLAICGFDQLENNSSIATMINFAEHILSVADVLAPGSSRFRGHVLFCLQFGIVSDLLNENRRMYNRRKKQKEGVQRGRKKRLEICRKYQTEIQQIFDKEPEDSEERMMLYTLKAHMGIEL